MNGLMDFLQQTSRTAGQTATGLVDLATLALRPLGYSIPDEKVFGTTKWAEKKGLLAPESQTPAGLAGQTVGNLLFPLGVGKPTQIASGLNRADDALTEGLLTMGAKRPAYVPKSQEGAVYGGRYAPSLDAKYGDKLDAYLMDSDGVTTLSKVVVPKDKRNQGIGTAFMNDLAQLADKDGVTLALSPSKDFGGNLNKLNQFYRGQGFVPNKGRFKDFTISETMLRPPGYQQPKPDPKTMAFTGKPEFFDAVGVSARPVKADVDSLKRKHPELFGSHADAADHVRHAISREPVFVASATDPKFTLTVQDAKGLLVPGGEDAYRSMVTNFGNNQGYQVRSAQSMGQDQLLAKIKKAKK
jgi:GNAT superfamily N-acetyltransferase